VAKKRSRHQSTANRTSASPHGTNHSDRNFRGHRGIDSRTCHSRRRIHDLRQGTDAGHQRCSSARLAGECGRLHWHCSTTRSGCSRGCARPPRSLSYRRWQRYIHTSGVVDDEGAGPVWCAGVEHAGREPSGLVFCLPLSGRQACISDHPARHSIRDTEYVHGEIAEGGDGRKKSTKKARRTKLERRSSLCCRYRGSNGNTDSDNR